jgi:hypothetical protein
VFPQLLKHPIEQINIASTHYSQDGAVTAVSRQDYVLETGHQ